MGQMKKLLDTIFEIGDTYYPDELDMTYEEFLIEQRLLSEEKELSLQKIKTESHDK